MTFVSRSIVSSIFIALFLCSGVALATDDAYLKMLEGEAEDVKLDQSGQLKDKQQIDGSTDGQKNTDWAKTDWKWEGDMEGDILPDGLAANEFASLLKQHFYGTFVFYRKLNSVDQATVFLHYTETPKANLDSIRQDILNHLKR